MITYYAYLSKKYLQITEKSILIIIEFKYIGLTTMLAILKEIKKYPTKPTNKETVWMLEFLAQEPKETESLMGWTSSGDTLQQVKLYFDTFKQASKYAKDNDIEYLVQSLGADGNVKPYAKSYLDIYRK